jgi:hypothetical protein
MTQWDGVPASARNNSEPPFFAVSLLKLTVLSLCTFGLYEAFWLYWNWRIVKRREGSDISPFWRTFFAFFYFYPLLRKIDADAGARHTGRSIPAGPLTIVWIVIGFLWLLPDPWSLLSCLTFAPLLPAQALVNRINWAAAPGHDPNARFTAWNWVGVLLGGAALVLVAAISFFPISLPDPFSDS